VKFHSTGLRRSDTLHLEIAHVEGAIVGRIDGLWSENQVPQDLLWTIGLSLPIHPYLGAAACPVALDASDISVVIVLGKYNH
jgi:hypothetical protein